MIIRKRNLILTGITLISLLGTGWLLNIHGVQAVGKQNYDLKLLEQIIERIKAQYVDDLNEEDAIDAAIRGMLGTLDPYTEFLEKKQNDEMKMMQIQGKYGGLGIKITKQDNALVVVALFDGTPAYEVGLQTGDRIVGIEDQTTANIDVAQAADLLRGKPGTSVTISVSRDGEQDTIDYTLTRAIITIPVVPYVGMLEGGIGYIKLNQFTEDASHKVEQALIKLGDQGAKGYIFDLRGNPGGLLEQAVGIAGKFLPKGNLVVYTMGRTGTNKRPYHVPDGFTLKNAPLVILVDRFSASASEIVAGAIQDWDRGVVVGQSTFGKASVQQIFPMNNGVALKMTTARYYTPSGRLIQKLIDIDNSIKNPSPEEMVQPKGDKYKTNIGRTVYGGGGINPDIEIKPNKYPNFIRALNNQSFFIKYASHYLSKEYNEDQSTFVVTEEILQDFLGFVEAHSFKYTSAAIQALDELEEIVEEQSANTTAMESIAGLRIQLNRDQKRAYLRNKELLVAHIGSEISAKLWGPTGRYAFAVKHDSQIIESLKIIKDSQKYQSLLKNNQDQ